MPSAHAAAGCRSAGPAAAGPALLRRARATGAAPPADASAGRMISWTGAVARNASSPEPANLPGRWSRSEHGSGPGAPGPSARVVVRPRAVAADVCPSLSTRAAATAETPVVPFPTAAGAAARALERLSLRPALLPAVDGEPAGPGPESAGPGVATGSGGSSGGGGPQRGPHYYANVGTAVRTLREELPHMFQRDLTYDIYRSDIVFRDPQNAIGGLANYQRLFWSLRVCGALLFSSIHLDVRRVWQSADGGAIMVRWTVSGTPRLPWEAAGIFDGTSEYKLDRDGLIYEHKVDNVILNTPRFAPLPLFTPAWVVGPAAGPGVPSFFRQQEASSAAAPPASSVVTSATARPQGCAAAAADDGGATDGAPGWLPPFARALRPSPLRAALLARFSWVRLYAACGLLYLAAGQQVAPQPAWPAGGQGGGGGTAT